MKCPVCGSDEYEDLDIDTCVECGNEIVVEDEATEIQENDDNQ